MMGLVLSRWEKWADRNPVRSTKWNAKSCIWGGITTDTSRSWGLTTGKQLYREDPGVMMDSKLTVTQQCMTFMAKKVNSLLGCIRKARCHQVERGNPSPLLSVSETHLESWVQCWATQDMKDTYLLEWVQSGPQTWLRVWNIFHEIMFSLEKSRLRGIISMCINTWWEGPKKMKPDSCQWCPVTGPKAMGTIWNTRHSVWTLGNTFLLWGWPSTGTGFPKKVWSLLSWRFSKPIQIESRAVWCRWPRYEWGGWTGISPEVLSSLSHFVISVIST